MQLYRLIYRSRVARAVRFTDAENIAASAAEQNRLKGITGLLLYTPSHFIQVLEGPRDAVMATYGVIARDPRHSEVHVIAEGLIEKRSFEHWGMHAAMPTLSTTQTALAALTETSALAMLHHAAESAAK